MSCEASSCWKNYRLRRSEVFSSFTTNNHLLFPVTYIGSPFGISLQANTRFPYHFCQPTRLKVKVSSDPRVEQLKIPSSFQDAYKMQMARSRGQPIKCE